MWRAQILVAALVFALIPAANANFDQCLDRINQITIEGKTDNHGHPLPPWASNATAMTYGLCVSECGTGQGPFQWSVFSQQFSSWLLPWLALVSQLPFGANDMLDNLESMLLTVGSPTLAAYSLALTVLNGRWIAQVFTNYRYPNVRSAVRILSNLQQSPLRVDPHDALLASLVVLPQNDKWWTELAARLNYTDTWSISAATSIAWVIIAYIFTIVDYFSHAQGTLANTQGNTNGQGVGSVGSLWLWLLPNVVGWLQLSPKCDSIRLGEAVERANSLAYVATSSSSPSLASSISERRGISLNPAEVDEARLDEYSTPPIFNYARFLPWVQTVMIVSDVFQNVSERNHHHHPVVPKTNWSDRNSDDNILFATAAQVEEYCVQRGESLRHRPRRRLGLDDAMMSRMFMAAFLALVLQWGTTGAAVIIVWFTPTVGLGCRSGSFITYGILSTLVWMMLLTSSILTYYSTNAPALSYKGQPTIKFRFRVARWLSISLRRSAKLIAALNAVWIVATGMAQFSSFFDRCYCNSSVTGLGKDAYNVITLTQDDAPGMRAAWIGGFSLASGAAAFFAGFVTLFINPPLPP